MDLKPFGILRPQPALGRWGAKFENITRRTSRNSAAPAGLGPVGSKVWEHTTARRDNCGLVDGASGASSPCWIYVGTRSTSPWASFRPRALSIPISKLPPATVNFGSRRY